MLRNPTFRSLTLTAKAFRSKLRSCTRWFATRDGGPKDGSGPEQVSARYAGTVSAANVQLALNRSKPVGAIGQLQRYCHQLSMETSCVSQTLPLPTYISRAGTSGSKKGKEAATEFLKILDHRGLVWNCLDGRARWPPTRTPDDLKGASPDIPIHKQAKAE